MMGKEIPYFFLSAPPVLLRLAHIAEGATSLMADLNIKAKEFIPSWIKKPAAPATAAAATAKPAPTAASSSGAAPQLQQQQPQAPANSRPTTVQPADIPWKAPSPPVAPAPAPVEPTKKALHMNPNASVFEPKFATAAAAMPQWPAASKPSPKIKPDSGAHLLPPSTQPLSTNTAPKAAAGAIKTVEEILAISKKSNLKVGAAVFVPGQRSNAKHLMGKPSPLTLTPASPDTEMLLFDAWCLYCLCSSATKEETYDPALVFRIDSVPTFWKTMNNLPEPTALSPPTTMYLFRDDINPKWEDPKNVAGGMWTLRVDRDKIDTVWLLVACKTIGESWVKEHRNTINGIALKVREKKFTIDVWVTERREEFPGDLMGAIGDVLPSFMLDFYTHAEIQGALKDKAALLKNAKKGRKK